MNIRKGVYEWAGQDIDLTGPELHVGDKAPEFEVVDFQGNLLPSSKAKGKVLLLATMPSVDTPVCDTELKNLLVDAPALLTVAILAVTTDLPFALSRWAEAAASGKTLRLGSDHRTGSLGAAYGVLDAERRILARAVFVIDKEGVIRHVEYCRRAGDQPNLEAAITLARTLV